MKTFQFISNKRNTVGFFPSPASAQIALSYLFISLNYLLLNFQFKSNFRMSDSVPFCWPVALSIRFAGGHVRSLSLLARIASHFHYYYYTCYASLVARWCFASVYLFGRRYRLCSG